MNFPVLAVGEHILDLERIERRLERSDVAAIQELVEQWEAGREAVGAALAFLHNPDGNATEDFERIGELFHRETGYVRPGCDQPAGTGGAGPEERQAAFDTWRTNKSREIRAALKAFVDKARGE